MLVWGRWNYGWQLEYLLMLNLKKNIYFQTQREYVLVIYRLRPGITNEFYDFYSIFVENCLYYDAIHVFRLRTGFNSADMNRFRSNKGKRFFLFNVI